MGGTCPTLAVGALIDKNCSPRQTWKRPTSTTSSFHIPNILLTTWLAIAVRQWMIPEGVAASYLWALEDAMLRPRPTV